MRLLFDGEQVAQGTAQGPGSSPHVNFDMSFTVPDVEPGEYEVTAVGTDFAVRCTGPAGRGFEVRGAQVLGAEQSRGGGVGADQSRGGGVGADQSRGGGVGSSLARTGIYAALLVAMAVALLVAGRTLLEPSRRRRRAATLSSPTEGQHKAPTSR